jgi:NAD+ synthase (glutamine-hydrolysing)
MCVLPPSYHAERYGNDDNRYDLRQILYDVSWKFQFDKIDALAKKVDELTA